MYYPVSLKVDGQTCLVVGGGKIALQKARSLVRAGARVLPVRHLTVLGSGLRGADHASV